MLRTEAERNRRRERETIQLPQARREYRTPYHYRRDEDAESRLSFHIFYISFSSHMVLVGCRVVKKFRADGEPHTVHTS